MTNKSILAKQEIDRTLQGARQYLEEEGYIQPALFLRIAGGDILHIPLTMPDTFDKRASQFFLLGKQLHERGLMPSEAVLLSEIWYVNQQDAPAATNFAPSEHPARQEAILVIGRSTDRRRYTQVIQPFIRDKNNRPLWQPIPVAQYDEEWSSQNGPSGLLDYLFGEIPTGS